LYVARVRYLYSMKKIGILTSGGDAPGMNACIRAAVRTAVLNDIKVLGFYRGYEGLIENDSKELTRYDVRNIIHRGGTFLKTARSSDFKTLDGRLRASKVIRSHGLDGMIVIGGDGSFTGANLLSIEHDLNWYNKVKSVKPQNCELIHIPTKYPHNHLIHGDGIYDNFEDYVNYPIGKSKFDVIFIDGRCRVECTSICHKISKPNTIVFVHDFMEYRIKNQNYDKMYDYLEKIESVETMCMFSVK